MTTLTRKTRVTKHENGGWRVEVMTDGRWETHSVWGGPKQAAEKVAERLRRPPCEWND